MFVAIYPPLEAIEDLSAFVEPRREADSPLRWAREEQWHLTLAFLPAVTERRLDDLLARLAIAAERRTPFELNLNGAGAFPDPAAAKVVWGGVAGDTGELERLATGCRAGAGKAGTEVDGGRFRPHVTLARIGRPLDVTRWLRVFDLYSGPTWQVSEFALVQSELGQGAGGRPRHQIRELFTLGAAPDRAD